MATTDDAGAEHCGQVKFFRDQLGYGFITVLSAPRPDMIGRDIFVHHTDITPASSTYKTLVRGEYVSFNVVRGSRDIQAANVRGAFGGTLMCDSVNVRLLNRANDSYKEPIVLQNGDIVFHASEDVFV